MGAASSKRVGDAYAASSLRADRADGAVGGAALHAQALASIPERQSWIARVATFSQLSSPELQQLAAACDVAK